MHIKSLSSQNFLQKFSNKIVGILGLGVTGMSCLRAVQKSAKLCVCYDDKHHAYSSIDPTFANVMTCTDVDDPVLSQLDILVVSPGIVSAGTNAHPLAKKMHFLGVSMISDIEMMFCKYPNANYIGVTGTNGKSTVTAMIAHILRSCGFDYLEGGNIGVPVMDLPAAAGYVLEVSSYQIELIKNASFEIVILTNLTPDHLDRYATEHQYYLTKLSLLHFLSDNGVFITIGNEENLACQYAKNIFPYSKIVISTNNMPLALFSFAPIKECLLSQFLIKDTINGNASFAAQACKALGCEDEDIFKGISSFKGLPHRLELVGTSGLVSFFNDSKATNIESTLYAFAQLSEIYWIAGGKHLGSNLTPLLQYLHKIKKCYFFGQSRFDLKSVFASLQSCVVAETLEEVFKIAVQDACSAGIKCCVLFSPAHKSFDQFRNFEHRGQVFVALCNDTLESLKV